MTTTKNGLRLPVYLDYQATTPMDPRVLDAMLPYFTEKFGNPHSRSHAYGWEAEEGVEKARSQVADVIGASEKEIIFTHGNKQELVKVSLGVFTIEGLSGHSDRRQLLNFVHRLNPRPKKIILNHGESSRCLDLASTIHKLNRVETVAPRNLETVRLR